MVDKIWIQDEMEDGVDSDVHFLHFSKVEGQGFGQWRLSMHFGMLVGLLSTCDTLLSMHTLDENILIKLGWD